MGTLKHAAQHKTNPRRLPKVHTHGYQVPAGKTLSIGPPRCDGGEGATAIFKCVCRGTLVVGKCPRSPRAARGQGPERNWGRGSGGRGRESGARGDAATSAGPRPADAGAAPRKPARGHPRALPLLFFVRGCRAGRSRIVCAWMSPAALSFKNCRGSLACVALWRQHERVFPAGTW